MMHYYFAGSDGSGKSTYIALLEDYFVSKAIKTQYIWIRSPKIFSKPLMLYCRIAGYTKYNYIDNIKYGVHEFYRSKFISYIFPFIQLIDFYIKNLIIQKKTRNSEVDVIIYDRHVLDTIVDLMVDTHRFDLHKRWNGKMFLRLIPTDAKILILHAREHVIRSRKIDTLYDVNLVNKLKAYTILSRDLNIDIIDNSNDKKEPVFNEIINKFGLVE